MSKYQEQHYKELTRYLRLLRRLDERQASALACLMAVMFAEDSLDFNPDKFLAACKVI